MIDTSGHPNDSFPIDQTHRKSHPARNDVEANVIPLTKALSSCGRSLLCQLLWCQFSLVAQSLLRTSFTAWSGHFRFFFHAPWWAETVTGNRTQVDWMTYRIISDQIIVLWHRLSVLEDSREKAIEILSAIAQIFYEYFILHKYSVFGSDFAIIARSREALSPRNSSNTPGPRRSDVYKWNGMPFFFDTLPSKHSAPCKVRKK